MTYRQAADYLNSFINYERLNFYPYQSGFKIERVQKLLQLLTNPHQGLPAVHVAGSKGKGSTCAFVANILQDAGFKVGLYTSPHLVDIRERIRILQKEERKISQQHFTSLVKKIEPVAEKLRNTSLGRLSYYEFLTALAFLYFKEQLCDFVVLETGIGGRLDATNLCSSLVCAVTPISYEHTQILGNTLEKIAREKAGIIKDQTQAVVSAPQRPAVLRIIQQRAQQYAAEFFAVDKDIRIKQESSSIYGENFAVRGTAGNYTGCKIRLLGKHQVVNAAVAIGCVEALGRCGFKISQAAIRQGLRNTVWPGRLQIISRRPRIILDAAHNQASARVLKETLTKVFKFRNLILVFAVSEDKDVCGMLKELVPLSSRIVLTKSDNPRSLAPAEIKSLITAKGREIDLTENTTQALKQAIRQASQEDLILVCGSLFLIGEILKKYESFKFK